MPETVRLDKWLWAARFYKTRNQATKDCSGGRIKRGTTSLKPAAQVQVGDHLDIPAADGTHTRRIEVTGLLEKRVSAALAREAYTDHTPEDVLAAARHKKAMLRAGRLRRQEGDQGRMTKKKRREWNARLHGFND